MANLSSVITQTVGSSTAGVNLITAPNQGSIWTATTVSVATTTTAAELPLGPSISQAAKFSLAGSTGSAYVDFDMPSSLLNTKLQLAWYARASVTTIGTITASLASFASSANRTSNTSPTAVTLQTSSVQSAAPSFQTTFDSNSQGFYRLTLNFPAASGQWYSLCQLQVGPGQVTQVAPVGEWQSYTPAVSTGSWTNTRGYWRRVGSTVELNIYAGPITANGSGIFTWSLPSGLTADLNSLGANGVVPSLVDADGGSNTFVYVGQTLINSQGGPWYAGGATGTVSDPRTVLASTSSIAVVPGSAVTSGRANVAGSADGYTAVSATFQIRASIPIAEWAGSGTVSLGQGAQVEYASNSSSGVTSDTFTFAYGPAGSSTPSGTAAAAFTKRVRFQYPIQSDDIITVEIQKNGGPWIDISNAYNYDGLGPYVLQNGVSYGVGIDYRLVTSTDIDVGFGRYYYNSGATYGAAGTDWSSLAGVKWRVRKAKASSPVGFGMAGTDGSAGLYKAGQAPGLTTGTAISAGYVGEIKTASMAANSTSNMATYIDNTLSLSLDGGVWHIVFQSSGYISHPNTGQTTLGARIYNVTDASNLTFIDFIGLRTNPVDSADSFNHTYHLTGVVNIPLGQTKVFKGQIVCGGVAGSPTAGGVGCRNTGSFYAVRIA